MRGPCLQLSKMILFVIQIVVLLCVGKGKEKDVQMRSQISIFQISRSKGCPRDATIVLREAMTRGIAHKGG